MGNNARLFIILDRTSIDKEMTSGGKNVRQLSQSALVVEVGQVVKMGKL